MKKLKIKLGPAVKLDCTMRTYIRDYLEEKIAKEKYRILALNVLDDHVHCVLVSGESERDTIVGQLKGYSAFQFHQQSTILGQPLGPVYGGVNPSVNVGSIGSRRYADGTICKLWAKGYDRKFIHTDHKLLNVMEYVMFNHLKHKISDLGPSKHPEVYTTLERAFES